MPAQGREANLDGSFAEQNTGIVSTLLAFLFSSLTSDLVAQKQMSKLFSKFLGFFTSRKLVGVDKAGNRYFTRADEIDGIGKSTMRLLFVPRSPLGFAHDDKLLELMASCLCT